MIFGRVLGDVGFEGDAGAFEEDDLVGPVVPGGVAVVRVVEPAEVGGDADRVPSRLDVGEHARVPDAFLPLAVGSVVVEVAELAEERALADPGAPDDCDSHAGAS